MTEDGDEVVGTAPDGSPIVISAEAREHIKKLHLADSDYVPDPWLVDLAVALVDFLALRLPEVPDDVDEYDVWEDVSELLDAGEHDLAVGIALRAIGDAEVSIPFGLAARLDWWLASDPYPATAVAEVAPIVEKLRLPDYTIDRAAWEADRATMYRMSLISLGVPEALPREQLMLPGQRRVVFDQAIVDAIHGIVATDSWVAGGEPVWRERDWTPGERPLGAGQPE